MDDFCAETGRQAAEELIFQLGIIPLKPRGVAVEINHVAAYVVGILHLQLGECLFGVTLQVVWTEVRLKFAHEFGVPMHEWCRVVGVEDPDPQRQSPNRSSRQSQAARWRHHTWSLGVSFLPVHSRGPAVEPVRSQSYRRSQRLRDGGGVCDRDAPLRRQRNSTR